MATINTWIEKHRRKTRSKDKQRVVTKILHRVRYRIAGTKKAKDIWPISLFEKKRDAVNAKKEWEKAQLQKATGDTDLSSGVSGLVEQWLVDCLSGIANKKGKIIRDSTIQSFRKSLKYVVENVSVIGELTNEWVKDYMRLLYGQYKGWTPYRRLMDLKSFCGYLKRQKVINWDPFEGISLARPKSKPRFYTDEEIQALEDAAVARKDLWTLLFIRLGYLCGMRFGEVERLDLEDVRHEPDRSGWGIITIWGSESKTDKSGDVPAPPEVMELIVQLCGKRRHGRVFSWEERKFYWRWARVLAKAGLPPAPSYGNKYKWADVKSESRKNSPYHGLRHSFVRRNLEAGADLREIMDWTRHKNMQVLGDTYGHLSKPRQRQRARELYEIAKAKIPFVGQMWGKPNEIDAPVAPTVPHLAPLDGEQAKQGTN